MEINELKFIGIRYIKDVTYEAIEGSEDFSVEHDEDDFGPIIHMTRVDSYRPKLYPIGCVALFETPEGTRIMSYSLCSENDMNSFSREEAKRIAAERALIVAETDRENLKNALGENLNSEVFNRRFIPLANSDINVFPSHLRRNVIITEYNLLKDIDMAAARADNILPKINRD